MPQLSRPRRFAVTAHDHALARRAARGRVVLIDDEAEVRLALQALLRDEGYACDVYPSADDYLLTGHRQPQFPGPLCVLVDVNMPGRHGLSLQEILAAEEVPVVLMSGVSGAREVIQGFRAGAVDFLLKPVEESVLFAAVAKALALDGQHIQQKLQGQEVARRLGALSPRELQVAKLVREGLVNRAIALRLGITERTVKHHRRQVLAKLGVKNLMELAQVLDASVPK